MSETTAKRPRRAAAAKDTSGAKPLTKVLAMDGGGIYGLFTVLMLKELCRKDETFLDGSQEVVFAGTSAGSLTALALASHEKPRELILSGKLEEMFQDPRLYTPKPGLGALTGLTLLTSWTGSANSIELLKGFLGEKTLGDLKHPVMVCAFDLFGDPNAEGHRQWRPRVFHNLDIDTASNDAKCWEIGYGATAPVGWRSMINGLTDGGIFADNPALSAAGELTFHNRRLKNADAQRHDEDHFEALGDLRMLSLGVGNKRPFYPHKKADWGLIPYSIVPTNLREGFWLPIWVQFLLQPAVEAATQTSRELFGPHRFHRLDPEVIGFPVPPVLAAMYWSRFKLIRDMMLREIPRAAHDHKSGIAVDAALEWIHQNWYHGKETDKAA